MKKSIKRTLAMVLALCSVLSLMVPSVLADEAAGGAEGPSKKSYYLPSAELDTLKLGQVINTVTSGWIIWVVIAVVVVAAGAAAAVIVITKKKKNA